jgi:hypothetical protein
MALDDDEPDDLEFEPGLDPDELLELPQPATATANAKTANSMADLGLSDRFNMTLLSSQRAFG